MKHLTLKRLSVNLFATLIIVAGLFYVAHNRLFAEVVFQSTGSVESVCNVFTTCQYGYPNIATTTQPLDTDASIYMTITARADASVISDTVYVSLQDNSTGTACYFHELSLAEKAALYDNGLTSYTFELMPYNQAVSGCTGSSTYPTSKAWSIVFAGNNAANKLRANTDNDPLKMAVILDTEAPAPLNTDNRFISLTPVNGTTTPFTTTIGACFYLNQTIEPYQYFNHINFYFTPVETPVSPANGQITLPITSSGESCVSTTTTFSYQGLWLMDVGFFAYGNGEAGDEDYIPDQILLATSSQFIVGSSQLIDQINRLTSSSTNSAFSAYLSECEEIIASSTISFVNPQKVVCATTTYLLKGLIYLFVPDSSGMVQNVNKVKNEAITRFPVGYFTDFVRIMSTSSTSSLPVINATVPSTLPGGGSHITLSFNNALDFALNATTSRFSNVSASSTRTLGEITLDYWRILVYLSAFAYIIIRITGANFMHKIGYHKTTV